MKTIYKLRYSEMVLKAITMLAIPVAVDEESRAMYFSLTVDITQPLPNIGIEYKMIDVSQVDKLIESYVHRNKINGVSCVILAPWRQNNEI
jgi:hypothetical protein